MDTNKQKFEVSKDGTLLLDIEVLKTMTIKEVQKKLPDNYLLTEDMLHCLLAFCKNSDMSCDIQEDYLPLYDSIIKPNNNE